MRQNILWSLRIILRQKYQMLVRSSHVKLDKYLNKQGKSQN